MSFLFQNYSFVKIIYLLIRCYKTRFFFRNTNDTDGNGVNKQNTHATSAQRKITLDMVVSMKVSETPFFETNPPILPTPPFSWEEKSELLLFSKTFESSIPQLCFSFFKLRK